MIATRATVLVLICCRKLRLGKKKGESCSSDSASGRGLVNSFKRNVPATFSYSKQELAALIVIGEK